MHKIQNFPGLPTDHLADGGGAFATYTPRTPPPLYSSGLERLALSIPTFYSMAPPMGYG